MDPSLTIANYVYKFLVLAYPIEFRRRFASEMACAFEESCAAAHRTGTLALAMLCWTTVYDLLITASVEHIRRFGSNFKSDLKLVLKSPAFAAAFGAVAGNLFFVQSVVVSPLVGVHKTMPERLVLLAVTSANIAVLWVASQVLYAMDRNVRRKNVIRLPSQNRICSFRRMTGIAMILALCPTIGVLVSARRFSVGLSATAVPARYWVVFPLLLLMTVSIVFFLQPLLTPHNSESEHSPAR